MIGRVARCWDHGGRSRRDGSTTCSSCLHRNENLHVALQEGRKLPAVNHHGTVNPNTAEIPPCGQARCLPNNRVPLPHCWLHRGFTPDPPHPKTQAGALRKQVRGWGKESCTQFQLQNLIVKPAGFEEQLDVYEQRRDKKNQEKIGSSQEEETARSPLPDLYGCCK